MRAQCARCRGDQLPWFLLAVLATAVLFAIGILTELEYAKIGVPTVNSGDTISAGMVGALQREVNEARQAVADAQFRLAALGSDKERDKERASAGVHEICPGLGKWANQRWAQSVLSILKRAGIVERCTSHNIANKARLAATSASTSLFVSIHSADPIRKFNAESDASIRSQCTKLNPNIFWECKHPPAWIQSHQPCSEHAFIAQIDNGFVSDNRTHFAVPGTVFTQTHWFQWQVYIRPVPDGPPHSWENPPKIQTYPCIGSVLQAYPEAKGHFPHEVLPRLLYLLKHVPHRCPILVAVNNFVQRYLDLLPPYQQKRILAWKGHGTVYSAARVYVANEGPYCHEPNPHNGGMSTFFQPYIMKFPRQVMATHVLVKPNSILLMQRTGSRKYLQHDDLMKALQSKNKDVQVFNAEGDLKNHIALFAEAEVVIGPHGAGFSNLIFCRPGTLVVEIGWDGKVGMEMDNMYARVSESLGLEYRLVVGHGTYNGTISVDPAVIVQEMRRGWLSMGNSRNISQLVGIDRPVQQDRTLGL